MRFLNIRHKHFPLQILCLSIYLICVFAYLYFPLLNTTNNIWKGYYTVIVDSRIPDDILYDGLESCRFSYIAANNTPVYVTGFDSLDEVMLVRVPDRLEEMDPRYDPYIRNLSNLYQTTYRGKHWKVFFIKDNVSLISASTQLKKALKSASGVQNIEFHFLDWNIPSRILNLSIFLIYALIVTLLNGSFKNISLFAFIPLLLHATCGGYYGFTTAILLMTGYFIGIKEWESAFRHFLNYGQWELTASKLIESALMLCILIFVSLFLLIPNPRPASGLLSLAVSIFSLAAIFVFQSINTRQKHEEQEHRIFYPLQLMRKIPNKERRFPGMIHPVFMIAILLFPLFASIELSEKTEGIPKPIKYSDIQSFSWSNLEKLSLLSESASLPNLANYITHRAYQDALLVSRKFEFPQRNKVIQIDEFEQSGEKIEKSDRDFLRYDDSWFARVLLNAESAGFTGLLMKQDSPVGVTRYAASGTRIDVSKIPQHFFICILVFFAAFFVNGSLTAQSIYGIRNLLIRRRRQAT
jgi:hypothetical protein